MAITYKGLWEKAHNKRINEGKLWKDIQQEIQVSNEVIAKINKNDYVSLRILEKFAIYFECDIGDLVQLKRDS